MIRRVSGNSKEIDHLTWMAETERPSKDGAQPMPAQAQNAATVQGASPTATPYTFFTDVDPWLAGKECPSPRKRTNVEICLFHLEPFADHIAQAKILDGESLNGTTIPILSPETKYS
jgi:hypothetical protein